MDMEKIKQWMEMAQKYQSGNFWDTIFDQHSGQTQQNTGSTQQNPGTSEQNNHGYTRESHTSSTPTEFPLVDIFVTDTEVIVIIELPGLRKEDVQLSLSGNKLLVKGRSKIPVVSGSSILNERKYGEFERLIELPEPTESKDVQARFDCGLLFVTYIRKYTEHENISIL
ncbi:Hsp20/alpha crystallin family protein [Pueribacillus theae]|uniref:Hsp20/alpha crystallin family protein n=1 Tax=Pueribacillus theae TaxID=2171751 RepID=A0A2U1K7E4_9BACI|nr:Hsp20/alpha crystallin family protein [Pueribacillus theae]PWA13446.1 Hsp20/alpha crystallin family protein [Pueribacillus theae]